MSQPELHNVYREFQKAHTTESNIIEALFTEIVKMNQDNVKLRAELMETKKLLESKEVKKIK